MSPEASRIVKSGKLTTKRASSEWTLSLSVPRISKLDGSNQSISIFTARENAGIKSPNGITTKLATDEHRLTRMSRNAYGVRLIVSCGSRPFPLSVFICVHLWFLIRCYAARAGTITNVVRASLNSLQQLFERLRKQPDAVGQHVCGHLVQTDSHFFEPHQHFPLFVDIVLDRNPRPTVIAKRYDRSRRQSVNGFGADKRFGVIHVRIGRILSRS